MPMINIVIEEVTINAGLGHYAVLALVAIFLHSKKSRK